MPGTHVRISGRTHVRSAGVSQPLIIFQAHKEIEHQARRKRCVRQEVFVLRFLYGVTKDSGHADKSGFSRLLKGWWHPLRGR
jgi:hypothetical protein